MNENATVRGNTKALFLMAGVLASCSGESGSSDIDQAPIGDVVNGGHADSFEAGPEDLPGDMQTDKDLDTGENTDSGISEATDATPVEVPDDTPVEIHTPPPRPRITVNAIPDTMNGKVPFSQDGGDPQSFRIRVPTGGFTVDIYWRPDEPWDGDVWIDSSAIIHLPGQDVAAGWDLTDWLDCDANPDPFGWPEEAALHTRCLIPEDTIQPSGMLVFGARFADATGGPGERDQITVESSVLPEHLDPFTATDPWLVVLSRDLSAPELVHDVGGTYDVIPGYLPEGNGVPDLDEALTILGLLSDNQAFSAAARTIFIQETRKYANLIFGLDEDGGPTDWGIDLHLWFEGDPGAPDPSTWEPDGDFSMIAVGGDPNESGIKGNIVGMAAIDWNNQQVEDNAKYNRGVFVTAIVRQILKNELGALVVKEISPLDGTPLGMYPGDEEFLNPDFDPASAEDPLLTTRFTLYDTIMRFATMAIASTLCHEMGHSLGLVPLGPPPTGLFGGMNGLSFTEGDPGSSHVDTTGLNVMQTGKVTSYLEALGGMPRFNPMNTAYLRRRLVVGEGSPL